MTEQFVLYQFIRKSSAVDRHEGFAAPRAAVVDGLRDQLLSCAGLAGQQYGRIRCGDARDPVQYFQEAVALANQSSTAPFGLGTASRYLRLWRLGAPSPYWSRCSRLSVSRSSDPLKGTCFPHAYVSAEAAHSLRPRASPRVDWAQGAS